VHHSDIAGTSRPRPKPIQPKLSAEALDPSLCNRWAKSTVCGGPPRLADSLAEAAPREPQPV